MGVQFFYIIMGVQFFHELVKAHIRSGKVSLMCYDDWSKDEPLLLERVKIKLRELDIDFFDYSGEFEPVPLTNRFIFKNT